jgi:hypothetical protein
MFAIAHVIHQEREEPHCSQQYFKMIECWIAAGPLATVGKPLLAEANCANQIALARYFCQSRHHNLSISSQPTQDLTETMHILLNA